ncbi:UPF0755 protein [Sanguibacter gelidistatuariae]|uniref:Endolytic murein transglycosylase n=1 Tax=Sanguibacter gelidistatuariae TaxID=1814289 RepID=A0A1G6JV41_9MICO|nr:endolytic transglycosylase MltG [Sanguibacter gelidistatuariae]SDC21856.1 UPF0755 protein [Sanguibacter gelidistatuariae]
MNDLFEGPTHVEHPHGEEHLSRAEKRELRAERKRAAKRRRRALISVLVAVVLIGAGGYFVWTKGTAFFDDFDPFGSSAPDEIIDYPGPGTGEVQVTVAAGAAGSQIGQTLAESGVVASAKAFTAAYTANPNAASIQPGTYNLFKEMKASDAVTALLDPANRADFIVEIPNGFNKAKTIARIVKVTGFAEADVTAAMADAAGIGLPAEAGGNAEGWLAPARYEFGLDSTPTQMIAQMVAGTVATLDSLAVPIENRQTLLTTASIVEKEAGTDADRPLMASVINNRLAIDMKLQMDATLHYFLGTTDDASSTTADTEVDNPYNTYKYAGLPPGPIASPSVASLQAVLTPADTDYLYWVAVDPVNKVTKFAATFAEHEANKKLYDAWRAEHNAAKD